MNLTLICSRVKDKKVGEGTYAVVYQGACYPACCCATKVLCLRLSIGREASTGRKVAIKKIKVGQFKDGLDMSAIREVKFLRELKHQNVIEVCHISFKWPPKSLIACPSCLMYSRQKPI